MQQIKLKDCPEEEVLFVHSPLLLQQERSHFILFKAGTLLKYTI